MNFKVLLVVEVLPTMMLTTLLHSEAKVPAMNCELFQHPPDFYPPAGLIKTDGVVNIIDFYQYDTWNETLVITETETASTGGTVRRYDSPFAFLSFGLLFLSLRWW